MSARHEHCPECGCEIGAKKRRSVPDHRRLMALIHQAFTSWPEAHEFQPESAEHLRAWLICKAGWREATPIQFGETTSPDLMVLAMTAAIKAANGVAFVVPHGTGVAVISPKSMSFRSMGQQEFGLLRDAITDIIRAETGIEAEARAAA